MPHIAPNITVSASDYVNVAIPMNTELSYAPSGRFFSERNGYTTSMPTVPTTDVLHTFELGHDDILLETNEFNTSVKELMNRIYQLEIEVHELKQGGTIKL